MSELCGYIDEGGIGLPCTNETEPGMRCAYHTPTEPISVTPKNYPTIFRAFQMIDYDNGTVNRLEPEREAYLVPTPHTGRLPKCEAALACLTPEQLDKLCTGSMEDVDSVIARNPLVGPAYELLSAYFNEWEGGVLDEQAEIARLRAELFAKDAELAALRAKVEELEQIDSERLGAIECANNNARRRGLERDEWKARAEAAEARVKALGEQLEADRTAVADGVTAIRKAVDSRGWLAGEGRGSYEWDDDRYRSEFGAAMGDIRKALEPLAKIAADWSGCPRKAEDVAQARIDLQARVTALEGALMQSPCSCADGRQYGLIAVVPAPCARCAALAKEPRRGE